MSDLNVEGMALAPGVVETIVSIAVGEVEGVASVGTPGVAKAGFKGVFGGKPSTQGIEIETNEEGELVITVRIEVQYGYSLPTIAANVREAVADAAVSQVGAQVASVDVYIDGIQFAK